ncbi:HDOD domain-containing protein [Dethiosulfovibrio sp. F2B]|uniref:HDOD domain-containing protein n=1 Tax=Dethiosulfovibrio faecalis TaxID=2720018 RepID=UPI001F37B84F|nr:HDOD domain-containing protein [Dethiosulfovibrio faecalis]MCF4152048.1 HDOD domain-containing protein [Dethiosulfovibrio faecalis]
MAIIGIDALEGRVLRRDLFAPNGRFILAEGTTVSDRCLDILRSWGVVEADVRDDHILPGEILSVRAVESDGIESPFRYLSPGVLRDWFIDLAGERNVMLSLNASLPIDLEGESDVLSLESLVSQEPGLVSYSPVLGQIIDVIESPRSSASHVAYVVEQDSALSAKLLRLVNSPLYGFPRTINSIEQAVAIVGSGDLMSLAIQVASITHFRSIDDPILDMAHFWEHSICCAIFARLFAGRRFRGDDSRYFIGGMLMNLGRMVMMERMPREFCRVLSSAYGGKTTIEAERDIFGYSSPHVTSVLLSRWCLPPELAWSVTESRLFPDCRELESSVFRLAEAMACAFGSGFAGDYFVPVLDDGVVDSLGLSYNELVFVLKQFDRQRSEIVDVFLGGIGG